MPVKDSIFTLQLSQASSLFKTAKFKQTSGVVGFNNERKKNVEILN